MRKKGKMGRALFPSDFHRFAGTKLRSRLLQRISLSLRSNIKSELISSLLNSRLPRFFRKPARTKMTAAGTTTLFLKEPSDATFTRVENRGSITLHDLGDLYNISSVLECDSSGNVQPRTMVIDNPDSVLHRGNHYIVRRDVTQVGKENRVTFQQRVVVKEFAVQQQQQQSNVAAAPDSSAVSSANMPSVAQSSTAGSSARADPAASLFDSDMSFVFDLSRDSSSTSTGAPIVLRHQPMAASSSMSLNDSVQPKSNDLSQLESDETCSQQPRDSSAKSLQQRGITHVYFPFVATKPGTGELVHMSWKAVESMLDRNCAEQWKVQHETVMAALAEADELLSVHPQRVS